MKLRYISTIAALALSAAGAFSQDLKQEITVEHEVVPERHDVRRLSFTPTVNLPRHSSKPLDYSSRTVNIKVPGTISELDPAAWADTIYTAPWRGYANIGLMPLFNADFSAGYKFIDNDRTRFAGFLQYNGAVYRGKYPEGNDENRWFRNHTATVDLVLHQTVGKRSSVDAGADFSLARYNMPGTDGSLVPQIMRRAGLQAHFSSSAKQIDYSAGFKYSHFAYNNTIVTDRPVRAAYRPVHENLFGLDGYMRCFFDELSSVGVDADFNIVANNRRSVTAFSTVPGSHAYADDPGSYNHGLLTFRPYYRFDYKNFRLNLGARVDFTFNSGKVFHIAPDVLVSWRPSWIVAFFAKAGGGEHQNTLSSLYGVTPYAQTMMAYGNSHIPLTVDAGVTLGSWRGLYLEGGIGYARANDWLMPVTDMTDCLTVFAPIDMRGFHWRVEAGYKYRDYGSLSLSYEGTQQGYDRGYYLWRDRAKTVLGAHLNLTPVRRLDIAVDYELRSGRRMWDRGISMAPSGEGGALIPTSWTSVSDLGRVSSLGVGVTYALTDQLSAFIYGNNLLNNRHSLIGLVPAQGINGLLGVAMKF